MAVATNRPTWLSVGWIIALIVLIVDVIFIALSMIDIKVGLLIGGVALAELVP